MGEFRLRPQVAGDRGWHFARLANDISNITTWWESAMSALGDYCGTDSAGRQFGAAYRPKLESIDETLPVIVQQLYGVGTTLDQLARQTAHNDATHARALRGSTRDHGRGRHR